MFSGVGIHGAEDSLMQEASDLMASDGADRARIAGLEATPLAVKADHGVAATIIEKADEVDALLIVMGTRGNTGVRSLLLGSVSHDVAHHAHRPLLIVPSTPLAEARRTRLSAGSSSRPREPAMRTANATTQAQAASAASGISSIRLCRSTKAKRASSTLPKTSTTHRRSARGGHDLPDRRQPGSRGEQRIGEAAHERGQPCQQRQGEPRADVAAAEADERSGEDIGRVVDAGQHARGGDQRRPGDEQPAGAAGDEQDREGDREGDGRVIARERRVVRRGDERHDAERMIGERPRARPDVRDHLVDAQREHRRGDTCGRGIPPHAGSAGRIEEPERAGRDAEGQDSQVAKPAIIDTSSACSRIRFSA